MTILRLQNGFTLIEVLTSVAVFSIGLISIASLSLTNLRNTAHGHSQSQATIIAEELADTMRANLVAYENNLFAWNLGSGEKICFGDTTCDYSEQAQYDADAWVQHAANALPGGTAIICMDSTPDDGTAADPACDGLGLNTVKLFWADTHNLDSQAEDVSFYRTVVSLVP